jgi:hypothetical protein
MMSQSTSPEIAEIAAHRLLSAGGSRGRGTYVGVREARGEWAAAHLRLERRLAGTAGTLSGTLAS